MRVDWQTSFDANDDGVLTGAGDLRDARTHTLANEIVDRELSVPPGGLPEFTLSYSPTGNLTGEESYLYVYDVLGRLTRVEILAASTVVVAEYRYDARGHRIMWRYPLETGLSNGEGREDLASRWHYAQYDDRWRIVEVYRDERELEEPEDAQTPPTTDADLSLYERYVYHNAGIDGHGGSLALDAVVLRDRNDAFASEGPETLEERLYYAQNWAGGRGDVVAMIRPSGGRSQSVRYSAYGRPFHVHPADYTGDGSVDLLDNLYFLGDWGPNLCSHPTWTEGEVKTTHRRA